MTRTNKKHYTVPELVAYDIVDNPPPPGMAVNCISCYGVSRQGVPDAHTVAWYPLARTPASAKLRARMMIQRQGSKHGKLLCPFCSNDLCAGTGIYDGRKCDGIPF